MEPERKDASWLIVLVGCLQGWLLFFLGDTFVEINDAWPYLLPVFSVTIAIPPFIALTVEEIGNRSYWTAIGAMSALLAALAWFIGASSVPGQFDVGDVLPAFVVAMLLIGALSYPFFRCWQERRRFDFPYSAIIDHAWRFAIAAIVAGVFTGVVWVLLVIWAGLLAVVGVRQLQELIEMPQSVQLITPIALAVAIRLVRSRASIVSAVRGFLLQTFSRLLPFTAALGLVFIGCLPFTGVEPLWRTGHATLLMLSLQHGMLILVNAAYNDGSEPIPYGRVGRRVVDVGLLVLPVFAALCIYATWLRVDQHGWTVWRIYGALIVATTSVVVTSYAIAVFDRRGWLAPVGLINRIAALVVVCECICVNTPLLDPRAISVRSQVARLRAGKIAPGKFDFGYLKFDGGLSGMSALELLRKDPAQEISVRALHALQARSRWGLADEIKIIEAKDIAKHITVLPTGRKLPAGLVDFILAERQKRYDHCLNSEWGVPLVAVDLDGDGKDEYLLVCRDYNSRLYVRDGAAWKTLSIRTHGPSESAEPGRRRRGRSSPSGSAAIAEIQKGRYKVVPGRWKEFRAGETTFRVSE